MQVVPMRQGNLSWIFPELNSTEPALLALEQCGQRLRAIAAGLPEGRAGWSGDGLEFWRLPSGRCSLSGFAESPLVTFGAELRPPGFYEGESGWAVEATIEVRCDHLTDCGMHIVEARSEVGIDTPSRAMAVLEDITTWLAQRSCAVAAEDWRELDPDRHSTPGDR